MRAVLSIPALESVLWTCLISSHYGHRCWQVSFLNGDLSGRGANPACAGDAWVRVKTWAFEDIWTYELLIDVRCAGDKNRGAPIAGTALLKIGGFEKRVPPVRIDLSRLTKYVPVALCTLAEFLVLEVWGSRV